LDIQLLDENSFEIENKIINLEKFKLQINFEYKNNLIIDKISSFIDKLVNLRKISLYIRNPKKKTEPLEQY
jgi:hypothetical protein